MALNLVQHRCGASVWERAEEKREREIERWLLASAAGAVVISGLRQRAAGSDERNHRRGQLQAAVRRARPADMISEASEESFPASDAPSWTPTTGNTGPAQPKPHY